MKSNIDILHIFNDQKKFSKDFFLFLERNDFDLTKHFLFHYGKDDGFYKKFPMSYTFASGFFSIWGGIKLLYLLFKSRKIVVHSLASPFLLLYLWVFPFLNERVYWVIWGKDLYFFETLEKKRFYHRIYEFFRKKVIKNIKNIVSINRGDLALAKLWYRSNARMIECFVYPSNLFKEIDVGNKDDEVIYILAGNSADPTNNHEDIFKKLTPFSGEKIRIYCPLSYGEKKYAEKISLMGKSIFGDKFYPLMEFIPYDDYLKLLSTIDIGIFNHERQQAFGTKVTLLGSGKIIYMSHNSNLWEWFKDNNIKVFDIKDFNLNPIDYKNSEYNKRKIKDYFSENNLSNGLKLLFE